MGQMKKKTKYMIVGMVGLGLVTFGLAKGMPAYERYVLIEHLEAEISESVGSAIDCYNTYIASEDAYHTQALAEELHHLAKLMSQLEEVQGEHGFDGSTEIRRAKEAVILRGIEAENKEYLLKGLKALEEDAESDGHGWFLQFYNMNTL